MNFTKRITALFLLSIFLFNTMGYFVAFKAAQYQIKSGIVAELKTGIITDDAEVITVDKNELTNIEWLDDGNEMMYNNKRYDILSSKENTTTVTFYCINDKKEETLIAGMNEHINAHIALSKSAKSNVPKSMANDVVKLFCNHCFQYNLKTSEVNITFSPIKEDFISAAIGTNTPPPELG